MFDLVSLIKAAGYAGLGGIVFAETGLFIGFFLPGDSLLFTAGFLASQGYLHIWALVVICFMSAVAGDSFGYAFGRKVGPLIFKKENSLLFHKDHLVRAEQYYNVYGAKTIIIARFVPVVRTFAPILAGVGRMQYTTFLAFNVIGGALWAAGLPLAGYYLGSAIPGVDRYILPIVAGIILVSIAPILKHVATDPACRAYIKKKLRSFFGQKQSFYALATAFVKDSFRRVGQERGIEHFARTEYWVRVFKPDAGEALRIAAFAHDIERAFRKEGEGRLADSAKGFRDDFYLYEHPRRGAEIMKNFLLKSGAPETLAGRVAGLIEKHEVGGGAEQNLLRDADSVSYLETNASYHISQAAALGSKKVLEKITFMYERIGDARAKEIAKPLYERAVRELRQQSHG